MIGFLNPRSRPSALRGMTLKEAAASLAESAQKLSDEADKTMKNLDVNGVRLKDILNKPHDRH